MSSGESLREKALRGGIYLTIRRGISIVLSFLGLTFVTRVLGPDNYGLYTAAFGLFSYLQTFGEMGTRVYLIRGKQDTPIETFHQAFWWLLFFGFFLCVMINFLMILIVIFNSNLRDFILVSIILTIILPFSLISSVPLALLERQLDYQHTTKVEIASQFIFYLVGIVLAQLGAGVWSVVSGFWISQLVLIAGFFIAAKYRPKWYWERNELKSMISYSFTQSISGWIYRLESLAPSVLLLPLLGKEAVGYFSLSTRFINMLSFASDALGRLSIPAFARIQDNPQKLRQAVAESAYLRILSNGLFYILFTLISPFILHYLLGTKWDTSIFFTTFSILVIYMLFSSTIGVIASALYVLKQNIIMIVCNSAYIISLFILGFLGIWLLPPSLKIYSLALAMALSKIPNFLFVDYGIHRTIGRPSYMLSCLWGIGCSIACFAPVWGWWLYIVALPFLVNPVSVRTMRSLIQQIQSIRKKKHIEDRDNVT